MFTPPRMRSALVPASPKNANIQDICFQLTFPERIFSSSTPATPVKTNKPEEENYIPSKVLSQVKKYEKANRGYRVYGCSAVSNLGKKKLKCYYDLRK